MSSSHDITLTPQEQALIMRLKSFRVPEMAHILEEQLKDPNADLNTFMERMTAMIDAEWQVEENPSSTEQYSTEIQIFANNRIGLFADISKVFTEKQIDITSMNVRTSKQGRATIIMTFDIHGTEELNRITDKIRQIDGVLDIQRTTG